MANLTITTDDDVLRRARMRALAEGSSVNAVLRDFLESYAGVRPAENAAITELLELSEQAESTSGGRRWSRDELHERS